MSAVGHSKAFKSKKNLSDGSYVVRRWKPETFSGSGGLSALSGKVLTVSDQLSFGLSLIRMAFQSGAVFDQVDVTSRGRLYYEWGAQKCNRYDKTFQVFGRKEPIKNGKTIW